MRNSFFELLGIPGIRSITFPFDPLIWPSNEPSTSSNPIDKFLRRSCLNSHFFQNNRALTMTRCQQNFKLVSIRYSTPNKDFVNIHQHTRWQVNEKFCYHHRYDTVAIIGVIVKTLTSQSCPRVGWTRESGRVGSGHNFAGIWRVGSDIGSTLRIFHLFTDHLLVPKSIWIFKYYTFGLIDLLWYY